VIRVEATPDPPAFWEAGWARDPRATLFASPRWMRAITAAYPRYRPLVLQVFEEDRVVGVLPLVRTTRYGLHQILSMPFGTYGGPVLVPEATGAAAAELLGRFHDLARRFRVMRFEMMLLDPGPELRGALEETFGDRITESSAHAIDLSGGAADLWRRAYRHGTRKAIAAAERAGVRISTETGPEAVTLLARLHAAQGRDWEGIQPHPEKAIAAWVREFGAEARILVARHEGDPLAACLVLDHAGREAHPLVSGARPEARPVRAFHLLIHTALEDAIGRGIQRWYFGGSGGNPRIEFFKASFGAEPQPLVRVHRLAGWARGLRRRPAWDR